MNIWQFQDVLTRRLSVWAQLSIALGLVGMLIPRPFWRGVAIQFVGWGLINLTLSVFGNRGTRRRIARLSEEEKHTLAPEETRKVRRILWVNTGLDVLYMLGGALFARANFSDPFRVGTGLGIILQGMFLFFFDWIHARKL